MTTKTKADPKKNPTALNAGKPEQKAQEAAKPATPAKKVEPIAEVNMQPGVRKVAGEESHYSYAGSGDGMRSNPDTRTDILDFFMAHPGEVFTYKDLAVKLKDKDMTEHKAWTATRDLEDIEDLVEDKKGNKKAHRLADKYVEQAKAGIAESKAAKEEAVTGT